METQLTAYIIERHTYIDVDYLRVVFTITTLMIVDSVSDAICIDATISFSWSICFLFSN